MPCYFLPLLVRRELDQRTRKATQPRRRFFPSYFPNLCASISIVVSICLSSIATAHNHAHLANLPIPLALVCCRCIRVSRELPNGARLSAPSTGSVTLLFPSHSRCCVHDITRACCKVRVHARVLFACGRQRAAVSRPGEQWCHWDVVWPLRFTWPVPHVAPLVVPCSSTALPSHRDSLTRAVGVMHATNAV